MKCDRELCCQSRLFGSVCALFALMLASSISGCATETVESSPLTYHLAKKIEKLIKEEDVRSMDDVALEIEEAVSASKLSTREANQLLDVVVEAEAQEWIAASDAVKKLIEETSDSR